MPVEDANFVVMTQQTLKLVESSESITEFWALNPNVIAMFIVISLILGVMIFLFFMGGGLISKILKNR